MGKASTRLVLRVAPGSSAEAVVGRYGKAWKIRVRQPAAEGRANTAVCRLVADTLALPEQAVSLLTDARSRDKVVEVAGLSRVQAEQRLAAKALQ